MRPGDDARKREGHEPEEAPRNVPLGMAALTVAVAIWGGVYFALYAGDGGVNHGDQRTLAALAPPERSETVDGAGVYTARCAACHQPTGAGMAGAFPPLDGSEWVVGDPKRPIAVVLKGLQGPIEVKGASFASAMPAQPLDDGEVAAVLTHIRKSWSNQAGPVDASLVAEVRATLGERGPMGGGAELTSLFP